MPRLVLTGATGFIGRALVPALRARGFAIHAMLRDPSQAPAGTVAHRADLLLPGTFGPVLAEIRPTHLLHGAWNVGPGYWQSAANADWVETSLALLRTFRATGGGFALGLGTGAEAEGFEAGGTATPYGAAKRAMGEAWLAAGGTAWARLFFPYGPGDRPNRLLPAALAAFRAGQDFACTDGTQRRDFIHVRDVATLLAGLIAQTATGRFDIGSGIATPVACALDLLAAAVGAGQPQPGAIPNRAGEAACLVADPAPLARQGLHARIPLAAGLAALAADRFL